MPKMLIIVVVIFLLLAGGAVAIMNEMGIGPFAEKKAEADPQQAAAAEDRPPELPRFININQLAIPIIRGQSVVGSIQIQLQIETSEENEEKLRASVPRLEDAFLRDLNGYLPRRLRDSDQVDVDILRERLKIIGERVVGKGLIESILVQSILNRGVGP